VRGALELDSSTSTGGKIGVLFTSVFEASIVGLSIPFDTSGGRIGVFLKGLLGAGLCELIFRGLTGGGRIGVLFGSEGFGFCDSIVSFSGVTGSRTFVLFGIDGVEDGAGLAFARSGSVFRDGVDKAAFIDGKVIGRGTGDLLDSILGSGAPRSRVFWRFVDLLFGSSDFRRFLILASAMVDMEPGWVKNCQIFDFQAVTVCLSIVSAI
jgi:hypothetical protein